MRKITPQLKREFHATLVEGYAQFKREREKGNRSGVRYRGMLTRLGGVEMAHQLLKSPQNHARVKSWSWEGYKGSMEYQVIQKKFRVMFSVPELQEANLRLKWMKASAM